MIVNHVLAILLIVSVVLARIVFVKINKGGKSVNIIIKNFKLIDYRLH